ncbi:MAG: carbohydrate binding domain-containing protein [Sedimentisphaerales bacterium]|nr:carbohydrate binding domain-containing protein [Sedimentisphaerales bacterium]
MKNLENIKYRPFFLLLLVIPLLAVHAKAGENLLVNPGFEEGTTGWDDRGCVLSTSTESRSGSLSGYATNRDSTWQGIRQSVLHKMIPGETYSISAWIKLDNASSDQIVATFEQRDDRGVSYIRVDQATGYNSQWTRLSGWFTLEVVGLLTTLDIYFEGPASGVNFYLDDVEVLGLAAEPTEPEKPQPDATGVVIMDTVYQELEGFGASGAWYESWLTAHPKKNEIYDCLFGQLGLDIYRLRNTYDISMSNIIDSTEIIQAAEISLGHPIKIMISSWSPPAYLKSNNNTARGTLKKDIHGNYMYDEFARWWTDSLVEYSNHGIIADYVNIQNEPDFITDWDTCKFTPTETADSAGYNLAFEAVYQELTSRMPDIPRLLAGEACGCGSTRAYIDALIEPDHAYGYAHHHYADGDFDKPDSFIPAMENFAACYGDKPLFQTEYSCGSDAILFSSALNLARHIHNGLVHEGVSTYCYWNLFWEGQSGLVSLDYPWQGNPGYTINPIYYAFKHYSAFTDPGWHRVEASTDSSGLRISAFRNPDANELTIVIINISDIDIDLTLSLGGFLPEDAGVFRTSKTENTAYIGTFEPSQPLTLPSQTITTLSLTGSYTPPVIETFEQGGFGNFNWSLSGDADWFVSSEQSNSGSYSAQAGLIQGDENSTLKIELDCVSGNISFFRKVSSESGFDRLKFSIDGNEQGNWSGNLDWDQVSFPVTAGFRTFEWTYSKDSSVSEGDDTAWIDDVVFPR